MTTQANEISPREKDGLTERTSDKPRLIPPVDVLENENEILVIADLPGVTKENMTIRMEDSDLFIQAAQPDPSEKEAWQPVEFYRTFRVPNTVDPAGITAELKQGVLHLTLKKREETKPRQIEVKVM